MVKNGFPIYDVVFGDEDAGMTAVSFVSEPAICQNFVYYSDAKKNEIPLSVFYTNHDKHEVVSPILIPNQLIKRYDRNNQVYYMRWSKETIQKIMVHYLIAMRNNNVTIEHPMMYDKTLTYDDVLEKDVYMMNMWLCNGKDDVINSKYGFSVPEGTLCVRYKVYNRKLWQRIKSGELKGLSIEAFCSMVKTANLTLNKQDKTNIMNKKVNLFEKMVMFANEVKRQADELAKIASSDETDSGEVELRYEVADGTHLIVKPDGLVYDEQGNEIVNGEYKLMDGNVLLVDAGKFAGTKTLDEVPQEQPDEAPIAQADEEEKKEDEPTEETETPSEEKKDEEEEVKQEEEVETPIEDAPADNEAPATLVEIEIGEQKFLVPQEVADYINSLLKEKDDATAISETFQKELAQMKAKTASTTPATPKINQSSEKSGNQLEALWSFRKSFK